MNDPYQRMLLAAARIREETAGKIRCYVTSEDIVNATPSASVDFDLYENSGGKLGTYAPLVDVLSLHFGRAMTTARINTLHEILRGIQVYQADKDHPLCTDCGTNAAGLGTYDCPACQARRAAAGDTRRRHRPKPATDATTPRFTG